MKPTFRLNHFSGIKYLVWLIGAFVYPYISVHAQDIFTKANQFNALYKQEKIYLHIDRPSYWANDDIWFKAYLKDSPIENSILYVELLNASGTVIQKKTYRSQRGLAVGDFHLSDTISSGIYQVRAYTNWMRNFDEQWFFRRNLVIWNLSGKKMTDDSRQLRQRNIDVQFFPEGGTFLVNQKTRMGFKATDENGKGLDVKGRIIDDQGNQILEFKSAFKGMGHFELLPLEGRKYTAEVTVEDGFDLNADLPVAEVSGVSLSVNSFNEEVLYVKVAENAGTRGDNLGYLLVGSSKGKILFNKEIDLQKGFAELHLQKEDLPTGILQLTVFDKQMIPRCERLVFVNNHDFIEVNIEPDKRVYRPGEETELLIESFTGEGDPSVASLSMSVYHSDNHLKMEDYPNNILTHFLLGSELKGLVEDPAYYFKDDSLSTLSALDNLMLTHGYRYFEWKQIMNNQLLPLAYKPESGIKIKGNIKASITEKDVANGNVSLVFLHDTLKSYQAVTDSIGHFEFEDFYFRDTVAVFLEARNAKGRKSTFIELDKSSWESPLVKLLPVKYNYLADRKVTVTFDQDNLLKINRKWRLSDTIMLNEVRVATSKYKFGERPLRLHDKADYALDLHIDDDELGNVFYKLVDKFSNVVVRVQEEKRFTPTSYLEGYRSWDVLRPGRFFPTVMVDYQPEGVVFVLDGKVVDEDLIHAIPAGAFERVEILKNGRVYGNYFGGAVCFFTKYGAFNALPNSQGEKNSRIPGYSVIRKFYSPNYDSLKPQEIKDDFRNTLYWDPMIKTDSEGEANVLYYNSNQAGEVQVVVEGVTIDGKICRGEYKYTVVPK
ncbi:MAG TPA: hypothetical protein VFG54_09255 [Prolixibacteraceae bacterium]|nr:hypothetical protein [Prolixibacteraceae bacterium]